MKKKLFVDPKSYDWCPNHHRAAQPNGFFHRVLANRSCCLLKLCLWRTTFNNVGWLQLPLNWLLLALIFKTTGFRGNLITPLVNWLIGYRVVDYFLFPFHGRLRDLYLISWQQYWRPGNWVVFQLLPLIASTNSMGHHNISSNEKVSLYVRSFLIPLPPIV